MITLKPAKHIINRLVEKTVIEIWDDAKFIGVIYPSLRGVKIISKYIENRDDLLQVEALEPAAVLVNLLRERVVDVKVDVKKEE